MPMHHPIQFILIPRRRLHLALRRSDLQVHEAGELVMVRGFVEGVLAAREQAVVLVAEGAGAGAALFREGLDETVGHVGAVEGARVGDVVFGHCGGWLQAGWC